MLHALYTLLWLCGLPFVLLRLVWRARQQRGYLAHLAERFGYVARSTTPTIWLHAVSVGETRAAEPLIRALLTAYPAHHILLTHMTPTGRATGQQLFGREARIRQAWLPYDIPFFCQRFFRRAQAQFGVIMETEVWPNLLASAAQQRLPVLLANARLSARSARGYARLGGFARQCFARFQHIAAQSADDAARFRELGGQAVSVCGNIKFDVTRPADVANHAAEFRQAFGTRQVILAASTREGEETLILAAFKAQFAPQATAPLLLLVPRHPQRFDEVAQLIAQHGLQHQRRSAGLNTPLAPTTRVLLGDSMGEMAYYYASADLALIGGSWLDFGSQNLIEACAAGVGVLIGPSRFNFAQVSQDALQAGAALACDTPQTAMQHAAQLLANPPQRQALGAAGLALCAQHQGCTSRLLAALTQLPA